MKASVARITRLAIAVGCACIVGGPRVAIGQPDSGLTAATANAASRQYLIQALRLTRPDAFGYAPSIWLESRTVNVMPADSARVEARAGAWATALEKTTGPGLQRDALGVLAGDGQLPVLAQHVLDARLAEPALSAVDRAATLSLAVGTFADILHPGQLAIARDYMVKLDALGSEANLEKAGAHQALAGAYFLLGRDTAAEAQAVAGLRLVPTLPVELRSETALGLMVVWAEIISGANFDHPGMVHARIDSLIKALQPVLVPTTAQVADDSSSWQRASAFWIAQFQSVAQQVEHIGRPSPAFVATHWFNAPAPPTVSPEAPDARQLNLQDGRVRILILGKTECAGCDWARRIARTVIKPMFPQIDIWYMMFTTGAWGTKPMSPDDEAEHIRKLYIDYHHETLPIGLWAGPIQPTADGGHAPESCVTEDAYEVHDYPTIVVVDGHGIVRLFLQGADQMRSPRILDLLKALLNERVPQAAGSTVGSRS